MGPWGVGTFEDELACDWIEDLGDSDPIAFFRHCLDLRELDYLEYLAGIGVVCTAEVVHALCGSPRAGLPDAVLDWLSSHRALAVAGLLADAIAGMCRVLGPESELRVRWEDHEELGESWLEHHLQLLSLLQDDLVTARRVVGHHVVGD